MEYMLELNMEPGKTALLPSVYGKSSLGTQMAFAKLDGNFLACKTVQDVSVPLRVVKAYKRMGVRALANGSVLPEIASRHASANGILGQLRGRLFRKTSVPVEQKVTVASSLVLSCEFFGCGGWVVRRPL